MSLDSSYRIDDMLVQARIDTPQEALVWPVVEFHGWVAFLGQRDSFGIYLNDDKVDDIHLVTRSDVEQALGAGWSAIGWHVVCDIGQSARDNGHAIVFDVRVRTQTVAQGHFRYKDRLETTTQPLKIVLHMPKTGGTSLRLALEEHRQNLFLLPLYHRDFSQIKNLSSLSMDRFDVAYGHVRYGIHDQIARPVTYMTVLRNPYDFVISLYFFAKYVQRDHNMLVAENIVDAVNTVKRLEFDNFYTRTIAGVSPEAPVTEEDLQTAIENIDKHFSFIGLAERSRQSFQMFSKIFGLPLRYREENVTPDLIERELMDFREVNHEIRKCINLDLILYKYAIKKFWQMDLA
ncbi:hypothetical protein GOZ78_14095 [Agrobacterium vitis]|uniref:Sulfotransferase family protein n=2 Tax=Agrobacterium vitis TaxID=373 RepID=A0ABD6G908_AGRVI|nr:hypothetical protein [Agrobacterium vitis]MUO81841.1 hypothetical protein [Agrobacterium vitis]MUO93517.1 hypothetical protein [Agrobacterium vitis]MUP04233.1 hypothetical protein [Agrobacterium vitis]MUZ84248.1 hypothetical protein [Agrobacterium vitis]MVA11155.1 hypothetical protein [Agrobacterium vitis]